MKFFIFDHVIFEVYVSFFDFHFSQTMINMNTYSAGRSEKHFKDPLVFRPERWLRENKDKDDITRDFYKLPFGFGARMCLGKKI